MRLGQSVSISGPFDGKPSWAIASLEVLEPVDGNTGSAGCELEKARLLLGIPAANALQPYTHQHLALGSREVIGDNIPSKSS